MRRLETDLPDLDDLAQQGRLILLPAGGGDLTAWTHRLAPLACPQFYLFDREQEPETSVRRSVISQLNQRPDCRAALTQKRCLENYLHPEAIAAACGVWVEVGHDTSVAAAVAQAHPEWQAIWPTLTRRACQRRIERTKPQLNTLAVRHMTVDLLRERDPVGEVIGWFRQIAHLLTTAEENRAT